MKNDWQTKKLGEICEVEYGTRVVNKRDGGSKYSVYGGGGATFFMDKYNREDRVVVARFAMSEQCTRFVKGRFFLNDSGLTISPKNTKEISQDFLNLQTLFLNDQIYSLSRGTAQKNLDVPAFRNMEIPYPDSVAEQKGIVKILDEVFPKIEKAKENTGKNLQNSRELFESYLQSIFANSSENWEEKILDNLCEKITDGVHNTPNYISSGVPFLAVKNLTSGIIDFSDTRFISVEDHRILTKRCNPEKEDILYTKVGTTGVAKVIDTDREFSIFVSVALLKIKNEIIYNRYLEYYLNSPTARKQAKARTRGMANKKIRGNL